MVHLSPHTCPWCIPPTLRGPGRSLFCWWLKPAWAIQIHRISIGHVCRCVGQASHYLAASINTAAAPDAACGSCSARVTSGDQPAGKKFILLNKEREKGKKKQIQGDSSRDAFTPGDFWLCAGRRLSQEANSHYTKSLKSAFAVRCNSELLSIVHEALWTEGVLWALREILRIK